MAWGQKFPGDSSLGLGTEVFRPGPVFKQGGEPRHVLLFANPQSQTGRIRQTIQVSFDDGRTWPKKNNLLLDEGKGRGYPSLSRVDDQHVGIVYEGSQADVVFEKISLHELLR